MKVGFYAGSFDPFTVGHLHVLKKACEIFDKVIIGIGVNPDKQRRFNKDQMQKAIIRVLERENISNAQVIIYQGLTTDKAKEYNSTFLIRGIRNEFNYGVEENLANINEEISGLDTIYIRAGKLGFVSSSMVFELLKNKQDVSKYLPKEIIEVVINKNK